MKISKFLALGAALLIFSSPVFALEYTLGDPQPHPLGVERVGTVTASGLSFVLDGPATLSGSQEQQVQVLLQTFNSWQGVKAVSLKLQVNPTGVEAVLVPENFDLGAAGNAAGYMPSGMWFNSKDYLEYDFRLAVKNVFVRIQGSYFDFEAFKARLREAIADPVAYVQKNDPIYLFSRLTELAKTVEGLQSDLNALRYSGTALANRDFFGGMHPLDPAEVTKVLALKAANPDKFGKAVYEAYKAGGGKLSDSEVFLILGVWYKDFSR